MTQSNLTDASSDEILAMPCHCGSERPYSECCFVPGSEPFVCYGMAPGVVKVRLAEAAMTTWLGSLIEDEYPKILRRFAQEYDEILDNKDGVWNEFLDYWLMYGWTPAMAGLRKVGVFEPRKPLALSVFPEFKKLAKEEGLDLRGIREATESPYSFFRVRDVIQGKSLDLEDLLFERSVTVLEQKGSQNATKGNLLFGRVVSVHDLSVFWGVAPYTLPFHHLPVLRTLASQLQEQFEIAGVLRGSPLSRYAVFNQEIIEAGLVAWSDILNNRYKGGEMQAGKEVYRPARLIFKTSLGTEELWSVLQPAMDPEGALVGESPTEGGLPWLGANRMVRGEVTFNEGGFSILVLTAEAGVELREEVLNILGDRVAFDSEEDVPMHSQSEPPESLALSPEVREVLKAKMEELSRDWVNQRVPVLDDQTPLEAMRSPHGRKLLGYLFEMYAEAAERTPVNAMGFDVDYLKKLIGWSD